MCALSCRMLAFLLGLAALAQAKEGGHADSADLGPAMPGEDKYWLKLQTVSFSEGKLTPGFDPKQNNYELSISNPEVESFTFTPTLQLAKYDLLHLPIIEIDGKQHHADPLKPIQHVVWVNKTEGPHDHPLSVKLIDPIGMRYGFFHIPIYPRVNEYSFRILQAPQFEKVVKISKLEVVLENGTALEPQQPPVKGMDTTGQYWFDLPGSEKGAYIQGHCNQYSTRMLVNGIPTQPGEKVWTSLQVPHATWMVECMYSHHRWTQNNLGRTYQLNMQHRKDSFEIPQVHLLPQDGKCTKEKTHNPDSPYGYLCRAVTEELHMVVTYDTTSVEVFLQKGSAGEQNIISGIQTKVQMPATDVHWDLRVQGVRSRTVPLRLVVAERCHEMTCPTGWVPKPALDQEENALLHLCHSSTCNFEDDSTTCCREAGLRCQEFALDFECPAGTELFKYGFCYGSPCQAADHHYCCKKKQTSGHVQFDMNKGKWKEWFMKQDEKAKEMNKKLADHVSFGLQIKVDSPMAAKAGKSLDLAKATEQVLHDTLCKKLRVIDDAVLVSAQKAQAQGIGFTVDIETLEGLDRLDELKQMSEALLKGKGAAISEAVQSGLHEGVSMGAAGAGGKGVSVGAAAGAGGKARGIPDATAEVTWVSPVSTRSVPRPSLDLGMELEIPAASDLGREGDSEQLQPEVQAAIRKTILSIADIPDKERLELNFAKVPSSKAPGKDHLGAENEVLRVSGTITLPHGKEGTKEVLEAKLRTPEVLVPKLNEVMESDVMKEEKQSGHVVGKKRDYKVKSLKLGKVSAAPSGTGIDLGALLGGPTTTTKAGEYSKEDVLKVWLKLSSTTTTTPSCDGAVSIVSGTGGSCLTAPRTSQKGLHAAVEPCKADNKNQIWFYSHNTGNLQSALGLCLSADLHGPPLLGQFELASSPQVLERWISYQGPGPTLQWDCGASWSQSWTYWPSAGQFHLAGSANPGLCLQVSSQVGLEVAICDGTLFSQQFWFNEASASSLLPERVKSVADVPIFAKPYFDGEMPTWSAGMTFGKFQIAPFAKQRAIWYLTQGCSPVPTSSCGTPAPDMPGVYIGQSVLELGSKADSTPWLAAFTKSPVEGTGMAMCFYDHTCHTPQAGSSASQLSEWLTGCNAGGRPHCRYCGGDEMPPCPKYYDCKDGGLHKGLWEQDHKDWCCKHFSIGCKEPYQCLSGLENWRSWGEKQKIWCCTYEMVACEDECEKSDPKTFRENHGFWCSTFGKKEPGAHKPTDAERFAKMIATMYSEVEEPQREEEERLEAAIPRIMAAVASGFLSMISLAVWMRCSRNPLGEDPEMRPMTARSRRAQRNVSRELSRQQQAHTHHLVSNQIAV
mmetsp:Transcript_73243/g.171704  ORF Transcript_73243/g.171704 Transcript_73243/m.171704 type:complete len:1353 (-) Transcript_73243:52-4110(-)